MTVIPLPVRRVEPVAPTGGSPWPLTTVRGRFRSPTGRTGHFDGSYRLEACTEVRGELHALGIFSGVLTDADGARVGVVARRQRTPADVSGPPAHERVELRTAEVDLGGFLVAIEHVVVEPPVLHCEHPGCDRSLHMVGATSQRRGRGTPR